MLRALALPLLLTLTACGSRTVVEDRPQTVSVPVTVPCVSGERPEAVIPLTQAHPDWMGKSVKQKTELAAAQALRYKSYGEALNASTGACQ